MKHPKADKNTPSQRQLRVSELIRHAVAQMLSRGDLHDPVLSGQVITIPEVRLSPDLKIATVYVMPLGGGETKEILAALEKQKYIIRTHVAHEVNMKYAPDLRFRRDESFDEALRIDTLLDTDKVRRDLTSLPRPKVQPDDGDA
jgi:ribosome-binding factor A